jgi:hypothetical protein
MKVTELKKQLEAYSDDTELIVMYWDRDFWSVEDSVVPKEVWEQAVHTYEEGEWSFQSDASDTITEIIAEETNNQEEK